MWMSSEIAFRPGEFRQYKAVTKFHVGKLSIDIPEGETVEFDGQILRMKGVEYPIPEVRSGIRVGWLVEEESESEDYKAKPADVRVRSAQAKTGEKAQKAALATVSDDEREVGPARREDSKSTGEKPKKFSGKLVREDDEGDAGSVVSRAEKRASAESDADARGRSAAASVGSAPKSEPRQVRGVDASNTTKTAMRVVSGDTDIEAQEGTPISKVGTPARQRTVIADASAAARAVQSLDDGPPRRAVVAQKKGPVSVLPAKDGSDLHAVGGENVEDIIDALEPSGRAKMMADQRKAALSAKSKAAPAKAAPEAVVKPAAKPAAKPAPKAPAKKAAKPQPPRTVEEFVMRGDEMDLGNGVVWDNKIHWRSRAKIAAEKFGSNPEALAAIRAVESPAVNALINERLTALAKQA